MAKRPPAYQFKLSAGLVIAVLLLLLLGAAFLTSFYSVPQNSVAAVVRLGKYQGTKDPGLRFKWPLGIDQVYIVPVERQQKLEFGFGTPGTSNPFQHSGDRRAFRTEEYDAEKDMVTGDLNAVLVEWVVQYRISEPKNFLFNIRKPEMTLRDASESVMREVVGDRTVDEVITIGRGEIEVECVSKLQELVDSYELGVRIDQIQLTNVNPPVDVRDSFNEVNRAQQERERKINVARREYEGTVPKAKGEAERMISEAEGYRLKRVNEAQGDAERFVSVFEEYQKAPEITKRRIYLETLSEVLPQLGSKVIVDEEATQPLPLLNLGAGKESQP